MEQQPKKKRSIFKTIFMIWFFGGIIFFILYAIISSGSGNTTTTQSSSNSTSSNSNTSSQPQKIEKQRQVAGKATDLGAGTFTGGKDIPAGLYDVTSIGGTGNFTVNTSDGDLIINEILGSEKGLSVSKVRTKILNGDKIQLEGINRTHFEPVTTPFVKSVQTVKLYSGLWTVGEDITAGRYKATAPSGGGNFIIYNNSGMSSTNEILGDGGVQDVTFDIEDGNVIDISSLNEVDIVPVN